ncbi:MAG: hypothetical protein UV59_C0045G0005 [Candidatus Gottesmanbacteria bacterium GW2011_GWA1_43_11]|uniref:Methyltransferase type 11 domain-containing protein n=1 Tax=Candidatus Gottesmanbacteria bacterium GW2011_GWA1_43_11 TaxID=1618436 RepID=A0A0G1CCH5_9BACT|nr:MAG: hypothetical protein UV59_C0045G0005 [Candidatus Gottesmanbacteria bacterium GW2011_GWA1_43_11]
MSPDSPQFEDILKQVPADYYDSGTKNNLLQKYWHNHKWANLARLLENRKARLLDVGCADGTTTSAIKRLFPKLNITGLDKYADAISYANKTKPGITFIQGDAHKLPFKKGSFDFVVAIETLEHLHDPDGALLEIHRVLAKNGYFVIVQDTDSLLFKTVWWFWTKWKGSVWNHSHINCLEPKELIKKVRKANFKIISMEYTNLGMEVLIKAQKK